MPIVELTSLDAPEAARYRGLAERAARREGTFVAEGVTVAAAALDAGCRPVSALVARRHIAGKAAGLIARLGDAPVFTADDALLSGLVGYPLTRGALFAFERPPEADEGALLERAGCLALLDGVNDGANLGAIFRSAAALGADGVLLSETCCDPLSRRALRVGMGTPLKVPFATVGSAAAAIERLRDAGFEALAFALTDDSVPLGDASLRGGRRRALVFGAEGSGLDAAVVAACDRAVRIPMRAGVDSLNVAAAAAVAFWSLVGEPGAREDAAEG